MAQWAPRERDTMGELADEVLAQVGAESTVIGVDGQEGVDLRRVAESLAAAFSAREIDARAVEAPSPDPDVIRTDIVRPFRAVAGGGRVLIVHGYDVVRGPARTQWHWSLWVEREEGRLGPHAEGKVSASAVLDVTDPEHPRREWNDAC